jgi:hypothetical protein
LVRFETIVSKGFAGRHYYCGGCDYSWRVADMADPPDAPSVNTDDDDKPDRSRPR